ncbi:MAG: hypothetical protein E3J72_00655 [Planctomycetota bacterium]|nr:MAG: hypothetical protein E3J72_00655 [Planctomycetota bacterium]
MPMIKDATRVKQIEFENHGAVLLKDIVAEGGIGYLYILMIMNLETKEIPLVVAAETNEFSDDLFFCAFTPEGHVNYGPHPEVLDIEEFERQAVELVISNLGEKLVG